MIPVLNTLAYQASCLILIQNGGELPTEHQSRENLHCSGRGLASLLSQRRHLLLTSPGAPSRHRHPPVQCLPECILIPTRLQSIYKTKTPSNRPYNHHTQLQHGAEEPSKQSPPNSLQHTPRKKNKRKRISDHQLACETASSRAHKRRPHPQDIQQIHIQQLSARGKAPWCKGHAWLLLQPPLPEPAAALHTEEE